MKKTLLVVLMLVLAFGLFADDAKVLPAGVIRLYAVPSYVFGSQGFNADGDKVDVAEGDFTFINFGAALEYGITDSISAAIQWAPGTNLSSEFSNVPTMTVNGPMELFAGAKIQILGTQGLVKNDSIRFAVAPGVMIPMAFGYDPEEEFTNMMTGEDYNLDPTNSVLAFGTRLYGDYVVNDMFFVNLYCEFIKYMEKDAADDFLATATNAALAAASQPTFDTVNYGYKLTTEIDFNFTKQLADGLSMSGGIPFGYTTNPQTVYDDDEADSDSATYKMYVNPDVSVFVTSLPLPLEFQVSYNIPLAGQNVKFATNTLTAQIKAYMKF